LPMAAGAEYTKYQLNPNSDQPPQAHENLEANVYSKILKMFDRNSSQESSPRFSMLSNKTIRVNRPLNIIDDFFPSQNPIMLGEKSADSFLAVDSSAHLSSVDRNHWEEQPSSSSLPHIIAQALELCHAHPNNYACWFVAGVALELVEKMTQAIEYWKKSLELNPKSIAVLSNLSELQQIGAISTSEIDYLKKFESLDKYLVHGNFETHTNLYGEFLLRGETKNAIGALRSLADWLQKQQGYVPAEVEILCFLGAMQAYREDNNFHAAELCKREAENLTLAVKKSPKDMNQLYFIADVCEEYGLQSAARSCFFAIISSALSPLPLILKSIQKCLADCASESLKECIKIAYKNTLGHPEIRYYLIQCFLKISDVNLKNYSDKKNKLRLKITNNRLLDALPELEEAYYECPEDSEINYYLGEYYSAIKDNNRAYFHFKKMHEVDYLNSDSLIRFCFFLLRAHKYEEAEDLAKEAIDATRLSSFQEAEFHWVLAAAFFSTEQFEKSKLEITKALENDSWNTSYLTLHLRLHLHLYSRNVFQLSNGFLNKLEHTILHQLEESEKESVLLELDASANHLIKKGLSEQAWALSKC
ncbi:MAG: hypothetical protein K2X39_09015, partial [Silvanigrellaceae bacterium]|nr:hypothetical protein [Silvanigrellaceae bacterium]